MVKSRRMYFENYEGEHIMDENSAWSNFRDTGSIEAYIRYSQLKNTQEQQEAADANRYGRLGPNGEERG